MKFVISEIFILYARGKRGEGNKLLLSLLVLCLNNNIYLEIRNLTQFDISVGKVDERK